MQMNWSHVLFSFKGRIGRQVWWLTNLAITVAVAVVTAIIDAIARSLDMVVFDAETNQFEPTGILSILLAVIGLANLWIIYALAVKRLHDRDRTGWWVIAPLIGLAIGIGLAFEALSADLGASGSGPKRFGPSVPRKKPIS